VNCSKYHELISARIDGEISKKDEEILEKHLEGCKECAALEKSLVELQGSLKGWSDAELPASIEKSVLEKASYRKKHSPITKLFRDHYRIPRGVAWAAMLLILVLALNSIIPFLGFGRPATQEMNKGNNAFTTTKVKITSDDIISRTVIKKANKL
jgi:anti-sigma factor RsiW